LIQLVRPVQNIKNLVDQGGRKVATKATKGVMVLLPVPIETTVQHVAETTLPSARGLTIVVNADFDKRLVSMRKVVAALNWLKQNNPFY
uniref:DUF6570 domain-containing protein n=1 Tax=Steinernema glaseri TaxID=37863 RepID=A0A1I8AFI0_9BILA